MTVSATTQFEFPDITEYFIGYPLVSPTKTYATLRYTLTGTSIEADMPLLLNITLTFPLSVATEWNVVIAEVDVTDAVQTNTTSGTPLQPLQPLQFVMNYVSNSTGNVVLTELYFPQSMHVPLSPQDHVTFTSAGYVGGMISIPLDPLPWASKIINYSRLPDYLTSYDLTQIYVQPYGTAETQSQNQIFERLTDSLTYLILLFASIEISAHFFENSTKEKSRPAEKYNITLVSPSGGKIMGHGNPRSSVKNREPHTDKRGRKKRTDTSS